LVGAARIEADPSILDLYQNPFRPNSRTNRQYTWPAIDVRHCLDGVVDQVEKNLLQLNAIAAKPRETWLQISFEDNILLLECGSRELESIRNNVIDLERAHAWLRPLDQGPDAGEHLLRAVAIVYNPSNRGARVVEVGG
jgi:hypothetical protein